MSLAILFHILRAQHVSDINVYKHSLSLQLQLQLQPNHTETPTHIEPRTIWLMW